LSADPPLLTLISIVCTIYMPTYLPFVPPEMAASWAPITRISSRVPGNVRTRLASRDRESHGDAALALAAEDAMEVVDVIEAARVINGPHSNSSWKMGPVRESVSFPSRLLRLAIHMSTAASRGDTGHSS